jgi:hypothetical protein
VAASAVCQLACTRVRACKGACRHCHCRCNLRLLDEGVSNTAGWAALPAATMAPACARSAVPSVSPLLPLPTRNHDTTSSTEQGLCGTDLTTSLPGSPPPKALVCPVPKGFRRLCSWPSKRKRNRACGAGRGGGARSYFDRGVYRGGEQRVLC